jgi:hypothetical protein
MQNWSCKFTKFNDLSKFFVENCSCQREMRHFAISLSEPLTTRTPETQH